MQCSYCTNAIMSERHSLRNVEHSNLKAAETNVNFISQYSLHLTSIQRKFCIVEMRQVNSTIECNYIIIICWNAWCATIARSHYIKDIVLKFLKVRFENLVTSLFKNWILQLIRTNSSRLSHVIVAYSFASDFIDFSIDFSWKTIVLLEESICFISCNFCSQKQSNVSTSDIFLAKKIISILSSEFSSELIIN